MRTLLTVVTGSRAHGLERTDSDTDKHGVYAVSARQLLGLDAPPGGARTEDGIVYWEARHAMLLALRSNPSVLELLWAPEQMIEERDEDGAVLISIRRKLLSQDGVEKSFFRTAVQKHMPEIRQRWRILRKMDSALSEEQRLHQERILRKRSRGAAMLAVWGCQLWTTGVMHVHLDDSDRERVLAAEDDIRQLELLAARARKIVQRDSVLPENPDRQMAEQWLLGVRERNWGE